MKNLLNGPPDAKADLAKAQRIIEGYRQGYFLMADEEDAGLGWYTSRKRALMPLDDRFRYPKSLRRSLNQGRFRPAIDEDFAGVVEGCARRPSTWISEELKQVYYLLHRAGWAHSFETWQGERLAGGILGIVIGGAFMGESMFYNIPEGSKVAMVELVRCLRHQGFVLFDAQMDNPHLERFGSFIIEDSDYDKLLQVAIAQSCKFELAPQPGRAMGQTMDRAAGQKVNRAASNRTGP